MSLKPGKTWLGNGGRSGFGTVKYDQVGFSTGTDPDPVLWVRYKPSLQPGNLDLLLTLTLLYMPPCYYAALTAN
jgi:hypothetical protein